MTVTGIAGIPGFMESALSDFVLHSKEFTKQETAEGRPMSEACGLFLFMAEDWIPGDGWAGKIVFHPITNTSKKQHGFVMDNAEVAETLNAAVAARETVAELVCMTRGWDLNTPWTVAFFEHATKELDRQEVELGAVIPADRRAEMISQYMREEMMDMAQGFERKAADVVRLRVESSSLPILSAPEWLMIRGINALAGIGHSHPSGDADMSPEDYHTTAIVESWRKMFQVRIAGKGQKKDSNLELSRSVGNWIYGVPERVEIFDPTRVRDNGGDGDKLPSILDRHRRLGEPNTFRFAGSSTLMRYDTRGKRGEWRGPF
ncbi:hypothetical protein SEA_WOLLYPOG_79 [Arthrobacter phage Wollypog]|uniref:Uncharacterized protein n=1 Tax=Arthrobacter phage Wollypog TaxID=2790985 RepID=A0A7T3N1I3_9CAUD|nr:hypothetical protein PP291_gp79 [Arthrobacter phage Wollypog]QPX62628.1 hypothetical protein SEA_WOLLYPOG_79 [Arthrobacter phage Wollypog]